MTNKDIKTCLELLHRRILHNSKFAEEVTEAEMMALVEVINKKESEYGWRTCPYCNRIIKIKK